MKDDERINTDGMELAQYVESILEKGKLPNYVGERPLVFPVCIGTNRSGNIYQLECKCQKRGSIYSNYPEQIANIFPKCAKCIEEIKKLHKQAVCEKEREARKARKQARKDQQRKATRSLPIWAQWLLPILVPILVAVLAFVLQQFP